LKAVLVRYKTHDGKAAENEALIHAVFDELRDTAPAGVRYAAFKLEDGVSFVHLAIVDTADGSNPLPALKSFERFQQDLSERCVEQPKPTSLIPVDRYGF
jgi:hypothetical protein